MMKATQSERRSAIDRTISDLFAKARKLDEAAARLIDKDLDAATALMAEATTCRAEAAEVEFAEDLLTVFAQLDEEGLPFPVASIPAT